MTFTNILFLFYFLPIILILYFLAPRKHRNAALFCGSLVFCAWGEPVCFLVLLFVMAMNYISAKKLQSIKKDKNKKLIFGLTICLNILFFLFSGMINKFIPYVNSLYNIGFMFVTLRLISYLSDIYRQEIDFSLCFINFGTYILMFPKMIIGPFESYADIMPQLTSRIGTIEGFSRGLMRFVVGFIKKILIADTLYGLWTSTNDIPIGELSVASSWLGIIAFGLSLYFNLSGYSDMSIGLGKMFGFKYSENFNYPFLATSVTEFFKRWLISLTDWLKKYIYVPLKNNAKIKVNICIIIVSVFMGISYNIGFNKVLWGLYLALIFIVERFLKACNIKRSIPKLLKWLCTMFFVTTGWVLFLMDSPFDMYSYFKVMFGFSGNSIVSSAFLYDLSSNAFIIILAVISVLPFGAKIGREYIEKNPLYALVPAFAGLMLSLAYAIA